LVAPMANAQEEDSCLNPLFLLPEEWGADSEWGRALKLVLNDKPMPYPAGSDVCKSFKGKDKTCCSKTALDAISLAFNSANDAITLAEETVKDSTRFGSDIADKLSEVYTGFCKLAGPIFRDGCSRITKLVDTFTQNLIAKAEAISVAALSCGKSVLAYAEGISCFACEVSFNNFLDVPSKTIKLTQDTCDGVYDKCIDAVQVTVVDLLQTVEDFAAELAKQLTGADIKIPLLSNVPDFCGGTLANPGNCKEFICYDMLNAFSTKSWLNYANWSPLKSLSRRLNEINFENLNQVEALEHVSRALTKYGDDVSSELALVARKNAASGHNTYVSAGGYPAYSVGCEENPDLCKSDGLSVPVIVGAVVAGVAAVSLVAVGVVAFRRRRLSKEAESQPAATSA